MPRDERKYKKWRALSKTEISTRINLHPCLPQRDGEYDCGINISASIYARISSFSRPFILRASKQIHYYLRRVSVIGAYTRTKRALPYTQTRPARPPADAARTSPGSSPGAHSRTKARESAAVEDAVPPRYSCCWLPIEILLLVQCRGGEREELHSHAGFRIAKMCRDREGAVAFARACFCALLAVTVLQVISSYPHRVQAAVDVSGTTRNRGYQEVELEGCQPDKLTVYKVILHTFWSRDKFPKHYPDWRPSAQWSKVFGRCYLR